MPRKRPNDPPGVSDHPECIRDPARTAGAVAEFRRRLAYLEQHYRMGCVFYGSVTEFNDGIRALNAAAAGEPAARGALRRLPPMLEVIVSENARWFARERAGREDAAVEGEDVERAARHVGACLAPTSHRPRADNLIHHVEGLMAVIQDFSGRPVVPRRYRNSEYDPHFMPGVSEIVPLIFRRLDPSVSVGQLVTIAEAARRRWAEQRPRFREYFPGYGLRPGPDRSLVSPAGVVVATFEPNIRTYFH